MRFFEALDYISGKHKVFGIDSLGKKYQIGTANNLQAAKEMLNANVFHGNYVRGEILDPSGKPVPQSSPNKVWP